MPSNSFTAYWDLETCPPTYDVVGGLLNADRERRRRGADRVNIKFVPGPAEGFRHDRFWPHGGEARRKVLNAVAVPMARMLPHATVEVLGSRPSQPEPNSIGWRQRLYGTKIMVECLRTGIRPLRVAPPEPPLSPRLVTITLREAEHWPTRNSNVDEWLAVAKELSRKGYGVVLVCDTGMSHEYLSEIILTDTVAPHDLDVRGRFYRSAFCNMFVNNGPGWFALALDAPVLMFKIMAPGAPCVSSPSFLTSAGLAPGMQVSDARHQRIVWHDDDRRTILAAFEEFADANKRALAS